ncbi:HNH endonuclease family protein [Paeniglutamicibacter sp. Y32M11]|uniref:HNH endonuclease family protein n=1 Tax=Paeniglutamicibacter sp. Y32M11 TaxID=2853258 RepID=UPI001C527C39|nr:HNH endonuclease family protein [Paeniglutamicibacter sp. Y32M11]QXQ11307.1 HNH endonuclease family protein [Paeniglutamicibacter sp. Y32M11]
MRRQDEVKIEHSFRIFTDYAKPLMTSVADAERLLRDLRRDADTYREFSQLDVSTPEGRFYSRVIERLELAVTTPVFLWLLSTNHGIPAEQRKIGLEAFESWAIRRMILRLPTKDMNKFAIAILKMLDFGSPGTAGHQLVSYLSEQSAETRVWPLDFDMHNQLPSKRVYGNIRQDRLRVILGAVEQHLRGKSSKYEAVDLPSKLEIEHVMPRGWRNYWDAEPKLGQEAAADRDALVNTIGNLTLVTKSLNGSLSNRPWTDEEASQLREGGLPGTGKRTLLDQFSLLVLNKEILVNHPVRWTEENIRDRSAEIIANICDVWPGPDLVAQSRP